MNQASDIRKRFIEIQKGLSEAESSFSRLPDEIKDKVLTLHGDDTNLVHCLRRGKSAIDDIVKNGL